MIKNGTPKHIDSSKIIRRRLSSYVKQTARPDDTNSRCLHMHIAAAGSATDAPMTILVAEEDENESQTTTPDKYGYDTY